MKAIRVHKFGGPEVLQLDDVPDPKPGPGQVVVRIRAAGVNPVDTYIRSGSYAMLPTLPYVPGNDCAGVIETVGQGVTRFKRGDRVYVVRTTTPMAGGYAELALCEASTVHPLPANVSFSQGAGVSVPYGTAYRGLHHKAHARSGETLLVHGASGGVGIAAVQLGVAHGMTVVGTAGTERGRKLVQEHGAHHVLDHSTSDYLTKLMEVTGTRGADVILEMLANVNLQKDIDVVARFGRIVVIGNRGTIEINPRGTMGKDAAIFGLALWNAAPEEMASIHAAIGAGLANSTLRPVVGQELPLKEAVRAHEAVLKPGAYGKIVLIP
ncbi:MAG: quinone oxidoreductase [Candidatus Rokubacteria bacterium 13_1_20CM_4_70_14]|nr:MAG: quinone oxidoreductase [Candidatus Rokubacteria bacterium 13_1_40CM_3_69_38]OLD69247.1 MAG: quinone oxidoreductase [Candidatus Rokubacteria bacterium 13_1_20CM_70_15]OLD76413.1 MAG: quinone oxidoreductase [Candidatus Rokubacteria bacterium 13_1_20CM_4_70_14]PYM48037.1 MAG: NADPH:quinone reductase [Candidatus Rokubacteria bacterium]